MEVNQNEQNQIKEKQQWKDFKAEMAMKGVRTSYAARQLLVQEYVHQEMKRKAEAGPNLPHRAKADHRASQSSIIISRRDWDDDGSETSTNDFEESLASLSSMGVSMSRSIGGGQSIASHEQRARRGSLKICVQHPDEVSSDKRRSSLNFGQFVCMGMDTSSKEEQTRRRASIERRQAFDTLVNKTVNGVENPKPRPKTERRQSFTFGLTSWKESSLPESTPLRRASTSGAGEQRRGSLDTSSSRRGSFQTAVSEIQQLSAYLSTFVDDDSDEEDKGNENEPSSATCEPVYADSKTELPSSVDNRMRCQRRASSVSTTSTSLSIQEYEPVEIETDGTIKLFSAKAEDEILVDFPSSPRKLSCRHYTVHPAYEEEFEKPANWVEEDPEFVKPSSWVDHDESDDEGNDSFRKPSNWVDHSDSHGSDYFA